MNTPIQRCPKWEGCNAPTCPLDPNCLESPTQKGEPTCLWLREAMKPQGDERIPAEILPAVRKVIPMLLKRGGAVLRGKLQKAALSGSKIAAGRAARTPAAGSQGSPEAFSRQPPTQRPEGELAGISA